MSVQSGYGPPGAVDPRATKLRMCFLRDASVHAIEPVETNMANYPDHSILLALRSPGEYEVPVVVQRPAEDLDGRRLLAVRPEDARKLALQLLQAADSRQGARTDSGHAP